MISRWICQEKQKVKNEQQLKEGRSELSRGFCGVDAEIFDGVGGGIMKGIFTAAQLSGTESNSFGMKGDNKHKKTRRSSTSIKRAST